MIAAIVQARMGSTRLPGKVLAPIAGRAMLLRQLDRVSRAAVDRVVVATSVAAEDDVIARTIAGEGHECFRGSLDDVLDRFHGAAVRLDATHVVRLTADCPLLDHRVIDEVLERHLGEGNDYTSNTLRRTYPDGEDVEVLTMATLAAAWRDASAADEREHVTPFVYRHPERFRLGSVERAEDQGHLRWTVDHPDDLETVRRIFERLLPRGDDFSMDDILSAVAPDRGNGN